jgi:hypothetical protein
MEVSGQIHAPTALLPGREPQYPLDRRLGGPQSWSGRDNEDRLSLPLPWIDPRLSNLAELSRLLLLLWSQYKYLTVFSMNLIHKIVTK